MANQQTGRVTIGGVVLAILAAIFYPRGTDDAAATGGGTPPGVSNPATAPTAKVETPAPKAITPPPTKPVAAIPATTTPKPAPRAPAQTAPKATTPPATGQPPSTSRVGFTSRRSLEDHFDKHGAEFGRITIDDYLAAAKALRDAPLSKDVLELVRADGVTCRFDQRTGNFIAFHDDQTIRTLFRPNDGVAYFRRQADR